MTYPEQKDTRTGKAIEHQKAAFSSKAGKPGGHISNTEIKPSDAHKTVDLYFTANDDIARRILEDGWDPEYFTSKKLLLTSLEQYAKVLAQKKKLKSIIQVRNIPLHAIEPGPQYKGEFTTEQLVAHIGDLVPQHFNLTKPLPKDHFVGRRTVPNMEGTINMASPKFIIRDDKKMSPEFLKEWHLDQYLQRLKAKDIEKMVFIQKIGSISGVPDNTRIYMGRYIPRPGYEPEDLPHILFRWNPYGAEIEGAPPKEKPARRKNVRITSQLNYPSIYQEGKAF